MKVLVTGATGFVGKAVVARLCREPRVELRVALRDSAPMFPNAIESIVVKDIFYIYLH